MLSRRALLGLGITAAIGAVGLGLLAETTDSDDEQLRDHVLHYVDAIEPGSPYRPPNARERTSAIRGIADLFDGGDLNDIADSLMLLGMSTVTASGPASGAEYHLAQSAPGTARGWGLYACPTGLIPRLLIEVPHPGFDLYTEHVAIDILRRLPASILAVAGAYRHDNNDLADVAHQPNSLFHRVVTETTIARGLPQIQLHGFDDAHAPNIDIVISAGVGATTSYIRELADALDESDFKICRAWHEDCNNLEGKKNVQGKAAASANTPFVHLEINRTLRENESKRDALARCVAAVHNKKEIGSGNSSK